MTEENYLDDNEDSEGENWNPLTETREWSAAVTELTLPQLEQKAKI